MTDPFWDTVDTYFHDASRAHSARDVVDITVAHFPNWQADRDPSADAIFPGSGGDKQLIDALAAAPGWTITWAEADYHWRARDPQGVRLDYIEGDLYIRS